MQDFQCPLSGGCVRGDLPGECQARQLRNAHLCQLAERNPAYLALLRGEPAPESPRPKPKTPSLVAQAASLATAVVKHVAAGRPQATAEQRSKRLAICHQCEDFAQGRCLHCGCYLMVKVGMAGEACPNGKWPPISPEPIEPAPAQPAEPVPAEPARA